MLSNLNSKIVRCDEFAKLLSLWADLHYKSVPDWSLADDFLLAAIPYFKDKQNFLLDCLDRSNGMLAPFPDPFEADFGAHRWLKDKREEAYSDWFAWLLEQLGELGPILEILGVNKPFYGSGRVRVTREYVLKEGHHKCSGRVDLLVECGQSKVIMVEIKLGSADGADTLKHRGYARSLPKQVKKVLVAKTGESADYYGFQLERWEDVVIRLRKQLVRLDNLNPVVKAMALAFVASVEQNVLGYPGNIREYIRRTRIVPTSMIRHIYATTGREFELD